MRTYFQPWHLLPLAAFFLASVIVGGFLLRRLLARQFAALGDDAPAAGRRRSRASAGKCMVAMLLAAMGAGFAAVAIIALFMAIKDASHESLIWPYVVGAILTMVAMPGVAYVVLLAMFPLPAGRMLRAAGPVFALVLAFAVVTLVPTGVLAYRQKVVNDYRDQTIRIHLPHIDQALRMYEVRHNAPADALQDLVETDYIDPQYLRSPADPDGDIGYFYFSKRSIPGRSETDEIRVCDYKRNFDGKGRGILLLNGRSEWVSEEEFQQLLDMDVNSDFAEALRQAEGE